MSVDVDIVLAAIGRTEASDFNDLCRGLGSNLPQERSEWADLFRTIEQAEREGLVEVSRLEGKIDSLVLTEAGANHIRGKLDSKRGLFSSL